MSIILIVSFVIAIMIVVKLSFVNLVNMFTDYTNVTGKIDKNLGKGKYVVRFYRTPWLQTTVTVKDEYHDAIPEGTVVTLEKIGFNKYKIYCWITRDPEYVENKTDFEKHMHYCNEVSKKINAEENNGKA